MRRQPGSAPYVSKSNTLDDIDWNDLGIIADIRAVFAVLAEIEVRPTAKEGTAQASTTAQSEKSADDR